MNVQKTIIPVVITLSVIGILAAGTALLHKIQQPKQIQPQKPAPVQKQSAEPASYTVRSETIENIIEIAGTVSAANEQKLQTIESGIITGIYVKQGDTVQKGDLLLKIDDTSQLYEIEKQDYVIDQNRINGSSRNLDILLRQRQVLERKAENRLIRANFDGTIAYLDDIHEGDFLEANEVIGMLIDRKYLKSIVEVAEADAPKLRQGQRVRFNFPAYPQSVSGYVVSSYAAATITSRGASVVKTEVRIDYPPRLILPNYSFSGEIEISPPEVRLLVEKQGIGYAEDGSAFAERIKFGGITEKVSVQAEPYGSSFMRIISGLQEGDTVKRQQTAASKLQEGRTGILYDQQADGEHIDD